MRSKLKLPILGLIIALAFLSPSFIKAQSTLDSYTNTARFLSNDFLQTYQGARIAIPSMTLPNSLTTFTSTNPFQNNDILQVYNAVRGMGAAVTSLTASCWSVNGNSVTSGLLGTTINQPFSFITNGISRGGFGAAGNFSVNGSSFTWTNSSAGYTNDISLQGYTGFTEIPAIYVGVGTKTNNNYAVLGDGINNVFNAPNGFFARTNNTTFLSAYTQYTTNGTFIQLNGITVPTVASNNNISSLRLLGNDLTYSVGTTATQQQFLISADVYRALTTATITDASALDVTQGTTGAGMTITRKWAVRFIGNQVTTGSSLFGAALGNSVSAVLDVRGDARITHTLGVNTATAGVIAQFSNSAQGYNFIRVRNEGAFVNSFTGLEIYTSAANIGSFLGQGASVTIGNAALGLAGTAIGISGNNSPISLAPKGTNALTNAMVLNTNEQIGIGTQNTTIAASAKVEIVSTTQGFLFPRMTTAQKNAIASPVAGLVVYDTTLQKLCVYTTAWETITSL